MRKLYPVFFALTLFIMANSVQRVSAQCLCSGGVPATAVTYYEMLDTTNASTSTISFPQFDPSIGTLSCVSLIDTISGITTTQVQNTGSTKTQFEFLLLVANNISGPGVSVNEDFTKIYGPDSLNAGGTPGDSITYGPDNIFSNVRDSTPSTNTAPYLGVGSVSFVYSLNGGLNSLEGGFNYNTQIITNYWGGFKLIYYWCPSLPLAINISDFTAYKNGENIQLQWQTLNEQENVHYVIESSTDGSVFANSGTVQSNSPDGDSVSSYHFVYPLSGLEPNRLYFRIKRVDIQGNVSYSAIKVVDLENLNVTMFQAYPNPATEQVTVEFNQVQTGNFIVTLVNTTGQALLRKAVTLNGTNQINLDLGGRPAAGLYFLQVRNPGQGRQYGSTLLIK